MVTEQTSGGVRQRKRRATANAITVQMVRLTRERGFDAVTIDDVAQAAQVSRRTFFNYFASKEDALFGNPMAELEPDLISRFVAGGPDGDLVGDALTLIIDQNLFSSIDISCMKELHEVMTSDPKLLVAFKQRMHAKHDEFAALVARREGVVPDDPRVKACVALIQLVMGLSMERITHRTDVADGDIDPEDLGLELTHTVALLQDLLNPSHS